MAYGVVVSVHTEAERTESECIMGKCYAKPLVVPNSQPARQPVILAFRSEEYTAVRRPPKQQQLPVIVVVVVVACNNVEDKWVWP